jgi:hypothetical protein
MPVPSLPPPTPAQQIKARKLQELAASGVPSKYQAELATIPIKASRL